MESFSPSGEEYLDGGNAVGIATETYRFNSARNLIPLMRDEQG
jgi:hypothetical protein